MSIQETDAMDEQQILQKIQRLNQARIEIGKVIVGQDRIITELMISIIAGGHCILEGVPGLAKTLMVSTLGQTLELGFHRVQFTPDLMPSDIIGTEILEEDHVSGKRFFKFQQGPVFTNILLADEINRTPPKTQAALLEAMQERSVSYGGKSYELPKPFFVLATQNPVEQAGTYPLPEAQLDRFLMFVRVPYPSEEEEIEILNRTTGNIHQTPEKVLNADDMLEIQSLVRDVEVSQQLLAYITRIVRSTRPSESNVDMVRSFVRWGASPRAGQSLVLCAKGRALLCERFAVTLDDIHFVAASVLRHRILLNFQAEAEGISSDDIVVSVLKETDEPSSPIGQ